MQKHTYMMVLLLTLSLVLSSQVTAQETAEQLTRSQLRKLLMDGVNAFQEKKYAQAAPAFEQLVGQYPELQDYVQFFLANTYLNLGKNQQALLTFQKFLADYPSHPVADDVRLNTANLLLGEKKYTEAIALYTLLLTRPGKDQGNIYDQLGKAYLGTENDQEAVFAFQQVIAFHPEYPSIEDTKQHLQEILKKNPQLEPQWTEDTFLDHAHALFKAGFYKPAITEYEAFKKQYPQSTRIAECEFGIVDAYFRLGNAREGLNTLEQLVTQYQTTNKELAARALYTIGTKHWSADRNDQAQAYMQRIVKAYAQTSWADDAYYVIGRISQDDENYQDAAQWYYDLYKTYPNSEFAEESLWRAGWSYSLGQQYAQADQMFSQRSKAFPTGDYDEETLYWQGRTYEKMQNRPTAIKTYQQLVQRSPETYYGLITQKRLRLLNVTVAPVPKKTGKAPELSLVFQELKQALQPATYAEIALHVGKVLELQEVQLTTYAAKEVEWMASLYKGTATNNSSRPLLFTYFLSRLYALTGKYLNTIQLAAAIEAALKQGNDQGFSYPIETLKYPLVYWDSIKKYAQANNLDPFLVAAVIRQESAYDPDALSSANAKGLMQLIAATGKRVAKEIGLKNFEVSQLFDPETNIQLGTKYLADLLEKLDGNLYRALAAYNAGPDATNKWWPEKGEVEQEVIVENITYRATRNYVKHVLRSQHYYRTLYADLL